MNIKEILSPLGLAAIELDTYFLELQKLSSQIEHMSLSTDNDHQLAVKLLTRFTERATSIEEVIRNFSQHLEAAREKSSEAIKVVAEKAQLIQRRKEEKDQIQEKLNELGGKVKEVVSTLSQFNSSGLYQTEEQKRPLLEHLEIIEKQLSEFIDEAHEIQNQAHDIKFKDASSSAESLHATLLNAKSRLSSVLRTTH